jgi:hypothetical protein
MHGKVICKQTDMIIDLCLLANPTLKQSKRFRIEVGQRSAILTFSASNQIYKDFLDSANNETCMEPKKQNSVNIKLEITIPVEGK